MKSKGRVGKVILCLFLAIFGNADIDARTCNDSKYDADNDGVNEIRLQSSCNKYVQLFIQRISHKITNLTQDEWYIVDYKSAGYYKSPVKPGWSWTRTSDTYKSCPAVNKGGAEFTRTKPKFNPKVSVSSVKACVPGYDWLPDISFLKGLFSSASTDTLKLDTTLAAAEGASEDGNTLLAIHSEIRWDRDQELYVYTYTLTNEHDEAMDFVVSAVPSPDDPGGWEGNVDAHATVERSFSLSSNEEENDPVENVGYISFSVGEEMVEGEFMFSTISPDHLTPEESRGFIEDEEDVTISSEDIMADDDVESFIDDDESTEINDDEDSDASLE